MLIAGAACYVASDREFKLQGWTAYSWVSAYFVIISVEMAYGKHIVGPHLGLKSMWGPTMYTNVLSIVPMSMAGAFSQEHERLARATWSLSLVALLVVSCVIGVAISYTGWKCRSMVTATCFTVLGVANKMATVLVNCLIWDKHASLSGAASLCVCLVGAATYKQAPRRSESAAAPSFAAFGRRPAVLVVLALMLVATLSTYRQGGAMTTGSHHPGPDASSEPAVGWDAAAPSLNDNATLAAAMLPAQASRRHRTAGVTAPGGGNVTTLKRRSIAGSWARGRRRHSNHTVGDASVQ